MYRRNFKNGKEYGLWEKYDENGEPEAKYT